MEYDKKTQRSMKNFSKLSNLLETENTSIILFTRFPLGQSFKNTFNSLNCNSYLITDARLAAKSKIRAVLVLREDYDPAASKKLNERKSEKTKKPRIKKVETDIKKYYASQLGEKESGELTEKVASLNDEDIETSVNSRLSTNDMRDFPIITRLDEIQWC